MRQPQKESCDWASLLDRSLPLFLLLSFIVFYVMMWMVPTCVCAGCLTGSKNVAMDIVSNAYVHGQREGYFSGGMLQQSLLS